LKRLSLNAGATVSLVDRKRKPWIAQPVSNDCQDSAYTPIYNRKSRAQGM